MPRDVLMIAELARLMAKRHIARLKRSQIATDRSERTAMGDPACHWWWSVLRAGTVQGVERTWDLALSQQTEIPTKELRHSFVLARYGSASFDIALQRARSWTDARDLRVIRPKQVAGPRQRVYVLGPLPSLRAAFTAFTGIRFEPILTIPNRKD